MNNCWDLLELVPSDTSFGLMKCCTDSYVLCCGYIYSSKHIFGMCIILSCIQVKITQISFDTYFPRIINSWAGLRGLQKSVYFNWGSTCRKIWEPLVLTNHIACMYSHIPFVTRNVQKADVTGSEKCANSALQTTAVMNV